MNTWYKIMAAFAFMIISVETYAQDVQTSHSGKYTTFTVNTGNSLVLHSTAGNAVVYQWAKDGTAIPGALSKDFTATMNGMYAVTAFNSNGCASNLSDSVIVVFKTQLPPVAKSDTVDLTAVIRSTNVRVVPGDQYSYVLTAGDNSISDGRQVQLSFVIPCNLSYLPQSAGYGTVDYNDLTKTLTWKIDKLEKNNPLNLTVNVQVVKPGSTTAKAVITGPQTDPDLQNNTYTIEQQINSLIVPNVFTPNGDGVNDAFIIPGLDNFTENDLSITNRGGAEVYTAKNYKNNWTGQGLAEGTYFYILRAKSPAGDWETYKGYLTLLRAHI